MMNNGQPIPNKKNKRRSILLGVFALALLAFGAAFVARPQVSAAFQAPAQATQSTPKYQTVTVQRGALAQSIAGTGKTTSAQILNLGFTSTGNIASLNVQVGDHVKQGQVLATLDTLPKLELALKNAQLAEQLAQKALDDLQSQAAQNLAQSLADQSAAQQAYATAQQNLHQKGDPRCAPNLTMTYYFKWLYASEAVIPWQDALNDPHTGYGHDYILQQLKPLIRDRDIALANYQYCQGYTDQEIATSQANLQTAQANMVQAQAKYQLIKANNGIDPNTLQLDQANLKNTQLQVAKAQIDLAGATLTAPIDGTVTSVTAQVGQAVSKSTSSSSGTTSSTSSSSSSSSASSSTPGILILADLNRPLVLTNVDETDLDGFMVGCPATVTFNAYPNNPYKGAVSQVYPSLATTSSGASSAQGLVTLQNNRTPDGQEFPLGLTASVQVTCQQANNALQIPLAALHEPAGQPAYVYVLNAAGQPEKRTVTVGLKTSAFVEISSGLNVGERVITSPVTNP